MLDFDAFVKQSYARLFDSYNFILIINEVLFLPKKNHEISNPASFNYLLHTNTQSKRERERERERERHTH